MSLTSPLTSPPTGPPGSPATAPPRGRRRRRVVALAVLAATVAAAGPLRPAQADPTPPPAAPVVGTTANDCAPGGFAKPAGTVSPGYIYSPTLFNGTAVSPQPDDTFARDSSGHAPFTGRLQTRTANGREEMLVCAHVGTNTFDDALTPFATSAHPATIAPTVSIIDAAGTTVSYGLDTIGLTDVALAHYAGSTDVHEGLLQMWVPFTSNMHTPGFIVRTEIRGTDALAGGGTALAAGADEAYVHLGLQPIARNAVVDQAVGVALDDSAIGERPSDPGADDLQSLLKPILPQMLKEAVASQAPSSIPSDWEWSPGIALGTSASGTLDELPFTGGLTSLDVVDFNAKESRLQLHITGTMYPKLTLKPRAAGFVSILSGSCSVTAQTQVSMDIGVTLSYDATNTKLQAKVFVLLASGTTSNVQANGTLFALYTVIPGPMDCGTIEGDISDGLSEKMEERLRGLENNAEIQDKISDTLNTSAPLGLTDLANGPISSAQVTLPSGAGFGIGGAKYVDTAPAGHLGGKVWIWHEGIDVAASLAVTDLGGSRFPYSFRPAAPCSVVTQTHERTRPGTSTLADVHLPTCGTYGTLDTALEPVTTTPTTRPVATVPTVPTKGVLEASPAPAPAPSPTTVPVRAAKVAGAPSADATTGAEATTGAVTTRDVTDVATEPVATAPPRTTATTTPTKTIPPTTTPPTTTPTKTIPSTTTAPTTTAPKTTVPAATGPVATKALPGRSATTVLAPTSTATKINVPGIDVTHVCCLSLDPVQILPTDFDLGVVVNGATVNQLSRALSAGGGDGTGVLDLEVGLEAGKVLHARPSVAPMYLPNAPSGWTAPGAVKLFLPSFQGFVTGDVFTSAEDLLIGADAQINMATNHLVPLPSSTIAGRIRFLKLTGGLNVAMPPAPSQDQATLGQIVANAGPRALKILEGIAVPDLGKFLVNNGLPSMVVSNLSLATTGGGHLGIYLNVDPNPAKVSVAASWNGGSDTAAPTGFTATLNPTGFPGSGGYTVHWTIRNASNVVTYQSPAAGETSLTKSFSANKASGQSSHDPCDPTRTLGVKVSATVTRNNSTVAGSGSFTSPAWEVPINEHICSGADVP
jgi:hypothetical protein